MTRIDVICPYCRCPNLTQAYKNLQHPIWKEMRKFSHYKCLECGSLTTFPMPDEPLLKHCYKTYAVSGYSKQLSKAKTVSRQNVWYKHILDIHGFASSVKPDDVVADIGAGEGLLAQAMVQSGAKFSRLDCYDLHPAPDLVVFLEKSSFLPQVKWKVVDLSQLPLEISESSYNIVFLIGVIEHVREPTQLAQNLLKIAKPGGSVHIIGPCLDSMAHTLMRRRWPYIIPGEHLTIPTTKGLRTMVNLLGVDDFWLKKVPITYSLNYILSTMLGFVLPAFLDAALRLPIGVFALSFRKPVY
jgi:ubiquinone/menaquinone biosynthesis C-methylase UbiE